MNGSGTSRKSSWSSMNRSKTSLRLLLLRRREAGVASDDNVRTIYRDGLLLGKDELEDDQNYFRAALERRSLCRMYGIAWGLELALVDGSPTITPGVAYGGDGKAMIVRRPLNIAEKFARRPEGEYAVHLHYVEKENPLSPFTFCNQEIDPRIAEGFEVELADDGPLIREKARFEPQQQLPAQPRKE